MLPTIRLADPLPISLSLKAVPVNPSTLRIVSVPEPPVTWAAVIDRSTGTADQADPELIVSVPPRPSTALLPAQVCNRLSSPLPVRLDAPVASIQSHSILLPSM